VSRSLGPEVGSSYSANESAWKRHERQSSGHRRFRSDVIATIAMVSLLTSACAAPAPTSTPSPTVAATLAAPLSSNSTLHSVPPSAIPVDPNAWLRAPNVGQPDGFLAAGAVDCGCQKHPAIDSLATGVTSGPAGLVAVGWILQDHSGASWQSSDGSTWTFTGGFPAQTLLSAVAANAQRYVAIGRDGNGAAVWTSTTGSDWAKLASPAFAGSPLRLTSITAWRGGFVAGGYRGSDFFSADAQLWVSSDGLSWRPATDTPAFKDARVVSVEGNATGLVAVGQAGPTETPGPVVIWTSSDGRTWSRVPDGPAFAGGRVRSVAAIPSIGFVAVGEDLAGDTGRIWTSPDGRTWTLVANSPIFGRPGIQVRMYTVVAGPNGAFVGGTLDAGIQYGETAIWTSADGVAWARVPDAPDFLDSEVTTSTSWNGRVVAVGDRGAPDAYQVTVWLGPTGAGQ
jgi:hypothetical protein